MMRWGGGGGNVAYKGLHPRTRPLQKALGGEGHQFKLHILTLWKLSKEGSAC